MSAKIYTINEIKSNLKKLLKDTCVLKVILFGSYAKNTATENSDLDLVIDTDGKLLGFKFFSLVTKIEELFEKDVDAFEKVEIIKGGEIEKEINRTGVVVYEKQRI